MPHDRVVALAPVDVVVLEELVEAATSDAAADDVTPPLTPGDGWTAERVAWLRALHVDRRAGLAGDAREATWAVLVDGRVVGGARLAGTERAGELEAGLWLVRRARGDGVGRVALALLLQQAAALGYASVRARTRASNCAALRVLRQLGFACSESTSGSVLAHVALPGSRSATRDSADPLHGG